MKRRAFQPGIQPCPGLKVTANAGVSFTDALRRVYDLEKEKTLSPKDAARDPRCAGLSVKELLRRIRFAQFYPVARVNARVLLIFDCALTDWRARQITGGKTITKIPVSGRPVAQLRGAPPAAAKPQLKQVA